MSIVPLSSLLPPTTMADPGEAWELWQLDFSGGGNWEEQLVDLAHHLEQEVDGAKLGGVFSSVFGPIKVIVFRRCIFALIAVLQIRYNFRCFV